MNKSDRHMFGHTLLRVTLGLLFAIAGYKKLMNPEGVVGMLTGIGFIVPTFFAWILILSELIFGVLVFVGYKTKYTAWPLAFIMLVAETTVVAPSGFWGSNSFFHLITIAGLATIALTGPGKWALSRD
ncbi:MAG: DoxX family protein [Nanoarchaeota archaeon]